MRSPCSTLTAIVIMITLAGCAGGNVKSAQDYDAPRAPSVKQPLYDPNASYGSANATWVAPIYNRAGTIVHPVDPGVAQDRAPYETEPWATGAGGRDAFAPPGTF